MAAAWALRLLEDRFVAAEVRSAGTHASGEAQAAAYAIDAMRELGFDLRAHRSTPLDEDLMSWADHVVVMEPMHAEVGLGLLGGDDVERSIRALWRHLGEGADHVPDPHGRALDVYRSSARQIGAATEAFLDESLLERRGQS
jgi:protein-tyrosine-phosphatase